MTDIRVNVLILATLIVAVLIILPFITLTSDWIASAVSAAIGGFIAIGMKLVEPRPPVTVPESVVLALVKHKEE